MQFVPLLPLQAVALVVVLYVWSVYRLWLGVALRDRALWSGRLDGFAFGLVVSAGVVVVARVVQV